MESLSDDFSAVFVRAVSDALRIPVERVTVLRVTAGSVIIDFSVDIKSSEIEALPYSSSDNVQAAIIATREIGEYALVSVEATAVQPADTQNDPCATGDWKSCRVAGQPVVAIAAIGLGVSIVLLLVLRKVCCKKKIKVGSATSDNYEQWN